MVDVKKKTYLEPVTRKKNEFASKKSSAEWGGFEHIEWARQKKF